MPHSTERIGRRIRRHWASAACIAGTLVVVSLIGGWAALREADRVAAKVVETEVALARSHAERTVGRLESELADAGIADRFPELARAKWIRDRWKEVVPPPNRLFGAITDRNGVVLCHSDPSREGERIDLATFGLPRLALGPDVRETNARQLSDGQRSFDVVVPVSFGGAQLGAYHAGLNAAWLEERAEESRRNTLSRLAIVVGAIALVVLASNVLLYRLIRRAAALEHAVASAHARRVAELGQLMAGLAHEIRNPLNVVQLNLFTTAKVLRGETAMESEEIAVMLGESAREIERVDELIGVLLGYVQPQRVQREPVDLLRETRDAEKFFRASFHDAGVELTVSASSPHVVAVAGRADVRQTLLNLLSNARDSLRGRAGRVRVSLARRGDLCEMLVEDDGPGLSPEARERAFEPFFTTKETGVGLGLAIVRSMVESAGGSVAMESPVGGGCRVRVQWPSTQFSSSRTETAAA